MMAQVHSQTTEDFQGAQRHGQGLPPLGFLQGKNAPKNEGGFIAHRRRLRCLTKAASSAIEGGFMKEAGF